MVNSRQLKDICKHSNLRSQKMDVSISQPKMEYTTTKHTMTSKQWLAPQMSFDRHTCQLKECIVCDIQVSCINITYTYLRADVYCVYGLQIVDITNKRIASCEGQSLKAIPVQTQTYPPICAPAAPEAPQTPSLRPPTKKSSMYGHLATTQIKR